MLNRFVVALILVTTTFSASCAPSAPSSGGAPADAAKSKAAAPAKAASQSSSALQAVIDAAKQEGELQLWSQVPTSENAGKLLEAFNKRFGLSTELKQVEVSAGDFTTRLIAQANAGRALEADFGMVAIENVLTLDEKGLLETYDWVGTFGSTFPELERRVSKVAPAYQNKVLDYWHLAHVIEYRTDQFKESEIPRTWEGLADPKFQGLLVLEGRGYPFNRFAPTWGMDRVVELAKSLKANSPIFKTGSPTVAKTVATGEAALGVSNIRNVELDKAAGVPVDWVAPSEIPMDIEHAVVPKGAPHPNTARLWAAWITTEGRPMLEELEKAGLAWPEENSFLARRLAQYGTKFNFVETAEEAELVRQALNRVVEAYLAQ
jgi:iron(III) transport system substrate-binding protein